LPARPSASSSLRLSARNRPDHEKRFRPLRHRIRQRCVRRVVRQILLACEEANERTALQRAMVANRAFEHRIATLDRIENRARRDDARYVDLNLSANLRERSQMRG